MIKKTLATFFIVPAFAHAQPGAIAVATTLGDTTQIMQPTDIVSAHGVNISNDTKQSQMFYWTISLCPMTQPEHCQYFSDHTALYPGQHWSKAYTLHSTIVFKAIGTKTITAKTEITGAAYSVAYDSKFVDVHY